MSYKNDSDLVVLNRYEELNGDVKALLFETYDRIRDLTVSGPSIGGSGLGKASSFLLNLGRTFGNSSFQPILGNESINVPGTSYYAPVTAGTGTTPGGQAAFGLAPFAQNIGFVGGAAPIDNQNTPPLTPSSGIGSRSAPGPTNMVTFGAIPSTAQGGIVAGGANIADLADAAGAVSGITAGAGFGRNWVLPASGLVSGIGGLLNTLGPYFGPFGVAGAAAGSILNGFGGAVLGSFQRVSNQVLNNADVIMNAKVRNLEAMSKMLDAQTEVIKKQLTDSLSGDKNLLQNLN